MVTYHYAIAGDAGPDPAELMISPVNSWVNVDFNVTSPGYYFVRTVTELHPNNADLTDSSRIAHATATYLDLKGGRSGNTFATTAWAADSNDRNATAHVRAGGTSIGTSQAIPAQPPRGGASWGIEGQGFARAGEFWFNGTFGHAGDDTEPRVGILVYEVGGNPATYPITTTRGGTFIASPPVAQGNGGEVAVTDMGANVGTYTSNATAGTGLIIAAAYGNIAGSGHAVISHDNESIHSFTLGGGISVVRSGDCSGKWSARFENSTNPATTNTVVVAYGDGLLASPFAHIVYGMPTGCSIR